MKPGDIALIALPQANHSIKKRPVLLLKKFPGYGDWLVCGISTQLHQCVINFDTVIDLQHPDYADSGLLAPSLVRLGFLAVIPSTKIPGSIGSLSQPTISEIQKRLGEWIMNNP